MKKILAITLLAALTGCAVDPISTTQTNNKQIDLTLLFENDGCKVYRFLDGGRYVYYTDCRGQTEWQVSTKHSSTRYDVQTSK